MAEPGTEDFLLELEQGLPPSADGRRWIRLAAHGSVAIWSCGSRTAFQYRRPLRPGERGRLLQGPFHLEVSLWPRGRA